MNDTTQEELPPLPEVPAYFDAWHTRVPPSSTDVQEYAKAYARQLRTINNRLLARMERLRERAEKAEAALADARDALRWYYHRNCADSLMGFDDFVAAAAKEGRALRTTTEK